MYEKVKHGDIDLTNEVTKQACLIILEPWCKSWNKKSLNKKSKITYT